MPPAACCMRKIAASLKLSCLAPEFQLLPAGEVLAQQKIPLEMGNTCSSCAAARTDGFFAAVMERHAASASNCKG